MTESDVADPFRAAQDSSPEPFALLAIVRDESGRVVDFEWRYANPAALRVQQAPIDELRGRLLSARNPGVRESGLLAGYIRTAETGEPFETELHYRHEWLDTWFRITAVRVADLLAISFSDVSTQRRAQERARGLLALATGFTEAISADAVIDVMFREGLEALRADGGSLAIIVEPEDGAALGAGREFEVVRTRGYAAGPTQRYHRFPLTAGRPVSDASLSGRSIFLEGRDDWDRLYPGQFPNIATRGLEAFVALPVAIAGRSVAAMSFSWEGARHFDEETRTFIETIGGLFGQALARARAHDAEQRDRSRADFIAEAMSVLATSMDYEATLRSLARMAVPRLGDWCAVDIVVDPAARRWPPDVQRIAIVHEDPKRIELGLQLTEEYPDDWSQRSGLPGVLASGEPLFVPSITDAMIAAGARDERHLELLRALQFSAVIIVPLVARGLTLGALTLCMTESGRRYTQADLRLAEQLASRAAIAVDNTRLFAEATEARREAELSEARLRRVFGQAPVAIAVTSGASHVFESANAMYERIIGRGGIVGRSVRDALPEIAGQGIFELMDEVFASGEPYVGTETRIVLDRGPGREAEEAWFNFVFQPLVGPAGAVTGIVIIAIEVTAQVRARTEAEALRDEAQAANRAKSQFLATMSHELRTPLNAIGGYAELIEMGIHGPVTDAQRDALARMQRSQRHLLGLINDVLNFAKLEAGRVEYDIADVPVRELIDEIEPLFTPQLSARGLRYDRSECEDGRVVRADADKLQQVLLNLLSNAIKFTQPGGEVRLVCREAGGDVTIAVRDTGIGIPADRLAQIFEPFVQLDRDLSSTAEGTGLGLAISRDLARGMGGELTAESREGEGSTFTVTLPRGGAT